MCKPNLAPSKTNSAIFKLFLSICKPSNLCDSKEFCKFLNVNTLFWCVLYVPIIPGSICWVHFFGSKPIFFGLIVVQLLRIATKFYCFNWHSCRRGYGSWCYSAWMATSATIITPSMGCHTSSVGKAHSIWRLVAIDFSVLGGHIRPYHSGTSIRKCLGVFDHINHYLFRRTEGPGLKVSRYIFAIEVCGSWTTC